MFPQRSEHSMYREGMDIPSALPHHLEAYSF